MAIVYVPEKEYFNGKNGESLFYSTPFDMTLLNRWMKIVPTLLRRIDNSKDERSFALVGALAVEQQIDQLLNQFMLKYECKDCEMGTKIHYLKMLNILPKHIVDHACAIKSIRNSFAHNIEIETIGNLPKNDKNKLDSEYNKLPKNRKKLATGRDKMLSLALTVVHALQYYEPAVRTYRDFIMWDEFQEVIKTKTRDRSRAYIDRIVRPQ